MSLFAIADTHLSLSADKPMDIFNGWSDYVQRLEKNWRAVVSNGDTVVMTADQKAAMNKEFIELSTRLGNGQTMNEIVELYSKKHPDSTVSDQLQFIKKGTDSYPDGFFEKVQQLSVGSNTVLIMDNYIFLILRENPSEDEAKQYYDRYRDDCLKSLRGDEFKTIVEGYASELSVKRNDRVINKAVKEVLKDG